MSSSRGIKPIWRILNPSSVNKHLVDPQILIREISDRKTTERNFRSGIEELETKLGDYS